jgi:hypothetical protein
LFLLEGEKMNTPVSTRPKSLNTVVILLVVLAVLSAVLPLLNLGRAAGFQRPQGGQFQGGGNFNNGGGPNGNFNNGAGGNDTNGGNGNFRNGGGGGFNAFGIMRSLGLGGQFFGIISTGITVIGILLVLLSAYGVWKQKRWGLNLALVLGILFLLSALPGLFALRFFNFLGVIRWVLDAGRAGIAVVIAFMCILPSVRDFAS